MTRRLAFRVADWAERAYARALQLTSTDLSPDYVDDAREMFRDRAREAARANGCVAVLVTLGSALTDAVVQAWNPEAPPTSLPGAAGAGPKESMMTDLLMDVRFALRRWVHAPTFSLTALGTLALGIGLAAAMFSVVNGVLLRPLPFQDPDRLVMVWDSNIERNRPRFPTSPANFFEWSDRADGFSGLSAYLAGTATLAEGSEPARLPATAVRWNLFSVLGARFELGRGFTEIENTPGSADVVILGHRLWSTRFGRDPAVLGRLLTVNERPHRVVGVLADDVPLTPDTELWLPLTFEFDVFQARGARFITVVGRLAEGVALAGAQSQMDTLSASLSESYPANAGWTAVVVPVHEQLVGGVRSPLLILAAAVGLVLLIACANVLNLQIAQASTRRQEFELRRALGAGSARIVRQLVLESTVLASLGAAAGLAVAVVLTRLVVSLNPGNVPRADAIGVDGRVLAFVALLTIVIGIGIGIVSAVYASRLSLRPAAAMLGASRRGRRLRRAVVISEVAVAVMLVSGFGLVSRSLFGLFAVDLGFEASGLVTGQLAPPASRYPEAPQRAEFYQQVAEHLRAVPAFDMVAVATRLPLTGSTSFGYVVDREPVPPQNEWTPGQLRAVDPNYFQTMRVPLREGRLLEPRDDARAPAVVVVNETMAKDLGLGAALLGTRLRISSGDVSCPCEIVGVVADVRETAIETAPVPAYYLPQAQSIWTSRQLIVRSDAPLAAVAAAMRSAVAAVDPAVPLYDVQPVSQIVNRRLASPRFNAWLLGVFAALALVLAAGGIYGVTSFVVSQRMPELAVRVALGARPRALVWLVERDALLTAGAGLALGLGGAMATTRFLESMLINVSPLDMTVLAATLALLGVACAAAAWLPALRASRADPIDALRRG